MISVILATDEKAKQRALAAGFVQQTVLTRLESGGSNDVTKKRAERELMETIKPYQFLVSDYWGACNPD